MQISRINITRRNRHILSMEDDGVSNFLKANKELLEKFLLRCLALSIKMETFRRMNRHTESPSFKRNCPLKGILSFNFTNFDLIILVPDLLTFFLSHFVQLILLPIAYRL